MRASRWCMRRNSRRDVRAELSEGKMQVKVRLSQSLRGWKLTRNCWSPTRGTRRNSPRSTWRDSRDRLAGRLRGRACAGSSHGFENQFQMTTVLLRNDELLSFGNSSLDLASSFGRLLCNCFHHCWTGSLAIVACAIVVVAIAVVVVAWIVTLLFLSCAGSKW